MPTSTYRHASRGTLETLLTGFELIALGPADRRRRRVAILATSAALLLLAALVGGALYLRPSTSDVAEERAAAPVTRTVLRNTYVVQPGDTLSGIAAARLGDLHRWRELHALNKDVVTDANALEVGVVLRLPEQGEQR